MRLILRAVLLVAAVQLLAARAAAEQEPSFFIEGIRVEGVTAAAARIVIGESRIREGETPGEPELRDAMARIQRLPFIVATEFRLAKGSAPGRYVLVISVRPMSRFFLNAESTTTWSVEERRAANPLERGPSYVDQRRQNTLAVGGRMFVGAKGTLTFAAERVEYRNDRYTVAFSQYDLFGTRASISAVVSYLENPGARRFAGPEARNDWHVRDNLSYELIGVLPLGRNDSLRASWQRADLPVRYLDVSVQPFQPALLSLPEIRKELFFIHDSTNDPLFPTSGTRATAGAVRTSMPTAGLTILGRVKNDEYRATLERSFSLTRRQAVTGGASGWDYDRKIHQYRFFTRYSLDLWSRERTIRWGDLRFEVEGDRIFTRIYGPYSAESTIRAGLAYRGVFGVVRLNVAYNGWRQPSP